MKKFPSLFVNAVFITAALSQFIQPASSQVILSQESLPLCYIQTTNGLINLSSMCGFRLPDICSTIYISQDSKGAILSDFCKKNEKCVLSKSCNEQPIQRFAPNLNKPQRLYFEPSLLFKA